MGGLVNSAFKRIAPLFASATPGEPAGGPETAEWVDTAAPARMQALLSSLRSLALIDSAATEEAEILVFDLG